MLKQKESIDNETLPSSKKLSLEKVEEILLYFSSSIFGQNTVDEILWDLAKNCISQLGFVDCVVYLVDKTSQKLLQKAAFGPKNPKDFEIYKPVEITIGQGVVGSVAASGIARIVGDTSLSKDYIVDDQPRLSEIAVPIVHRGKVIGVLDSEHPSKNFFTQQHLRILVTMASMCANKIVNTLTEEKYREKQSQLFEIEKQLVDLKLATLRTQMNPHFIFNSLNAIQHFVMTSSRELAMKYLSMFSKLIRYILDNTYTESISLDEELKMLKLYLELEKLRFEGKFDYEISLLSVLNKHIIKIPFLLIQPFVEEAIEGRVLGNNKKGRLKIDFFADGENLCCSIKDNGISLKKSNILKSKKKLDYEPEGVEIAMRRIKFINQNRGKKIKLVVEDLTPHTADYDGTQVRLTMPLEHF